MSTAAYLALTVIPALASLLTLVTTGLGIARLRRLVDVQTEDRETWPSVALITPACNEQERAEAAIGSMLAVDYPNLDIIAVDDRSTDATGAILDRLAAESDRMQVLHIDTLPDGWLGKVHALDRGVEAASADWLLFMDADSHLAPGALRRAVSYAEEGRFDFLTAIPTVLSAGPVADAVFAAALAAMSLGSRMWSVETSDEKGCIGGGAFNLVRRSAYDRSEGLRWLRLEVADDFGMCLLIKRAGGKAGVVNGAGDLTIQWYSSFGEMKRLLQKNFFAITSRFSVARSVLQATVLAWIGLLPVALLLPVDDPALYAIPLVGTLLHIASTLWVSSLTKRPGIGGWLPHIGLLATAFMILRASWIGVRIGGVSWRGVVYRREELARMQRVKL